MLTILCAIHPVCDALSIKTTTPSTTIVIPSIRSSLNIKNTVRLMAVQDQNEIDAITSEAEDAIQAANKLMADTDAMTSNSPFKKSVTPPPPPQQQQQQQQRVSNVSLSQQAQNQLIAATVSGTVLGAIVSLIVETQLLSDSSVEPAVVTGILSIAFGAATFVVAKNPDETNLISKSVRYFLGQPLLSVGDSIQRQVTASIERTTAEIKSIPNKIQQSVEQKVDDTVTTIQNIPSNVQRSIEQQIQQTQTAASQKVQDTVSSIQQIPSQVKDAALDYADEIVAEIKATPTRVKDAALDIADEIVTEMKATPEKVQKQAVAFIEETIDDITAIPSKIVASVETTVNSGTATSPTIPQPPKLPPPIPKAPKAESSTSTLFVVPELPKLELPKIDIPKVELPSIPAVEIPIKRTPPTPTKAVISKSKPAQSNTAALSKQKEQEQAAAARQKAQQQQQAAAAAAKVKAQKEKEQLEQQKLKLQQAKQAAEQRERQMLIQEEAKEERRRVIAEQERQREQEILRKAQEAVQRSREMEEKKKQQKKQQEEAAMKRQQQIAEQQATAQMQKQQSSSVNGASGSFRVAGVPQARAPRGVPTIVSWKQRKDGGISGRIYGSTNFVDGERIETSVIVTGTVDNGYVVKTDSGSRYFLSKEKPTTKAATPDNAGTIQTLLSALPGATITLTKSAQEKLSAQKEAAAKKKAENVVVAKPRPTFSLFGSSVPAADVSSTGATKVTSKVAPRGVPTIQRWRKNRDGSVTGIVYGSSSFSDGEQVTTSPIAIGTIAAGELVRTGSGSKYFLA